ncbi:MAG: cupin domain-containing protein [Pseudomonadota bacterium]
MKVEPTELARTPNESHNVTRRTWLSYLGALAAMIVPSLATTVAAKETTAPNASSGKPYVHVPSGTGTNYNWGSDHLFVKVSAAQTDGAYTLIEDNMDASFALGLHKHEAHAETFYILEGSIDFYLVDHWLTLEPGATLHIPPGVPHAAAITPGAKRAKMIMIFQPGGFDRFLSEYNALSRLDRANPLKMSAFNKRHDFIKLGPVPQR